jgi:hypothetical protein
MLWGREKKNRTQWKPSVGFEPRQLDRPQAGQCGWLMVFSICVSVARLGFILAPVAMIEGLDMIWDK